MDFFMRWFAEVGNFFCLSLLWILCCLPIITIVPSCVCLYDSVVHCVHGGEEHACRRFFRTMKTELLRGILLSLLWAAIGVALFFGYRITVLSAQGTFATIYSMVYAGTLLIPFAVLVWLIAIQAKFSYRFWELHGTAFTFTIAHLPTTAGIIALPICSAVLILAAPALLVLLPCICATLQAHLTEKVFDQYIPQDE